VCSGKVSRRRLTGAVDIAEGEKHSFRYELTSPEIADRFRIGTTLASIAHLTDLHVTDVQSPARFEFINREYLDPPLPRSCCRCTGRKRR